MLRRERTIRRMVADLGLEITSFRPDGGSHWKVDIKAPNGRQRPFVFPTRESGNYRHERNEVATLRRWRREVCPELDTAEEAGTLQQPEAMKSALAKKLEELKIPLRREEDEHAVSRFVRPPITLRDNPPATPPLEKMAEPVSSFAPGTPEAALEQALSPFKEPPKEQSMSAQTTPINSTHNSHEPPARKPHKKREEMSFSDVMKFALWMNKERLEGYYVRSEFLEHASKVLGFRVSVDALTQWMNDNGVSMPQRPHPVRPKTWQDYVNDDLAAIAMLLADLNPGQREQMMAIVERRTKA